MTHHLVPALAIGATAVSSLACTLVPVSTTTPPAEAKILFYQDEMQSEPDVAAAKLLGHRYSAIAQYNDFSVGDVNGTVEWSIGSDPTKPRHIEKGFSLMGWANTFDGFTWHYKGKVRPPAGWWGIMGDPTTAVDEFAPFAAYMVQMGMSVEAHTAKNPVPSPETTNTLRDGFCVSRSLDAGDTFGLGDGTTISTPRVATCHRVIPISKLSTSKGIDQIAATVDWHGRLWVATEDRDLDRIRVFRNRNPTGYWDTFEEVEPCSVNPDADCIPDAALGNRRPIMRSTIPCSRSLTDSCENAPNAHQAVILVSERQPNPSVPAEVLLAEFAQQEVESLACATGSECASGSCSTFGVCECSTNADCPIFAPTCQGAPHGYCTGPGPFATTHCSADVQCPATSLECFRGGSCTCTSNAQCAASQACVGGLCRRKPCSTDTDCPQPGYRCPGPSDPEVQYNDVDANVCTQVAAWTHLSISTLCSFGTGPLPAPILPQNREPRIGSGANTLAMTTAFTSWFDVGYSDARDAIIRFAYVYQNAAGKQHVQLVTIGADATGEPKCSPSQSTEQRLGYSTFSGHQQFWPTVDYSDRSVFDLLASPTLEWQLTFFSTHNVVNPADRYLQPIGSTVTDVPLQNLATAVGLVPGANFFGPSDNYVCSTITPAIPGAPDFGYWGDYFRTSQVIVPSLSNKVPGPLNIPAWVNITAFPYSGPRPLGQISPCFKQEIQDADPQHVHAFAWLAFRVL